MIIKCKYCGYEWDYKGKAKFYICCPRCHYLLSVKKLKLEFR